MGAHPCREPISAQGPSILSAHGALSMTRVQPCPGLNHPEVPWGAFHVQGLSMPSDRFPGPIPCQRPILLRAHPCRGPEEAHPYPVPIHTEGPSQPRNHQSQGPMLAHSFRGPIPAQSKSIPRAHGSPSMPGAHLCPALTHPENHPCQGPIHPEGRWVNLSRGPMGAQPCR